MPPRITNQMLHAKLDSVLNQVSKTQTELGTIKTAVGDLEKAFTGEVGGKPGVNQKLAQTNIRIDILEAADDTRKKWIGAAVFAAFTGTASVIWTTVKAALSFKGGN